MAGPATAPPVDGDWTPAAFSFRFAPRVAWRHIEPHRAAAPPVAAGRRRSIVSRLVAPRADYRSTHARQPTDPRLLEARCAGRQRQHHSPAACHHFDPWVIGDTGSGRPVSFLGTAAELDGPSPLAWSRLDLSHCSTTPTRRFARRQTPLRFLPSPDLALPLTSRCTWSPWWGSFRGGTLSRPVPDVGEGPASERNERDRYAYGFVKRLVKRPRLTAVLSKPLPRTRGRGLLTGNERSRRYLKH